MRNLILIMSLMLIGVVSWAQQPAPRDPLVAVPKKQPAPPLASMGVTQCDEPVVIWVILADHHVIRFDKDHKPSTKEGTQMFLQWLATGPHDIYVMPCPVNT